MSNQDKNNDEIRDLLRRKLEASAPAEDGWNVPSQRVWAGLSDELAASKVIPKRNHVNQWLMVAVGILLALLLLRECSHRGQVGQMQKELWQLEDSFEKLQKNCDEKSSMNSKAETTTAGSPLAFGQSASSFGEIAAPVVYFDEQNVDKQKYFGASRVQRASFPSILPRNSDNSEIKTVSLDDDSTVVRPLQPNPISAIPTAFFNTNTAPPKPSLHLQKSENQQAKIPLVAQFHAGAALTGNLLLGEKPAIIARQKALIGWQTGVGLEATFNRQWSLNAGLQYSIHRIQTDYALSVPYTHNGEFLHDDGNYDNQYNHSLPSPLGNYPLQMVLTRESTANVEEGETMRLDLNIRQKIQQLSMPLHLRYGFGKHRWQAGVRVGVFANHTLAVEAEDKPDFMSHHGAIHQRHTSVGNPSISDLKRFTFDASLGLDLRYLATERLGFSLASHWQRGISPIYQGDSVKNYLQSFGVNAGIQVWIR